MGSVPFPDCDQAGRGRGVGCDGTACHDPYGRFSAETEHCARLQVEAHTIVASWARLVLTSAHAPGALRAVRAGAGVVLAVCAIAASQRCLTCTVLLECCESDQSQGVSFCWSVSDFCLQKPPIATVRMKSWHSHHRLLHDVI